MSDTYADILATTSAVHEVLQLGRRMNLPAPSTWGGIDNGRRVMLTFRNAADLNWWAGMCDAPVGHQHHTAEHDEHRAQANLMGVELRLSALVRRADAA